MINFKEKHRINRRKLNVSIPKRKTDQMKIIIRVEIEKEKGKKKIEGRWIKKQDSN